MKHFTLFLYLNMVKIVFTDTNKIFGLFVRVVMGKSIDQTVLGRLTREGTFEFIISSFVLDELLRNIEDDGIAYTQEHIQSFLEQTGLVLLPSKPKIVSYAEYVHDFNDRQVLQDAIQMNAQYILTHNIKDFDRDAIYKQFGIRVINDLMYIM